MATSSHLIESETPKSPASWSPDGRFLAFWNYGAHCRATVGAAADRQSYADPPAQLAGL